jgi:predicted ATPase
MTQGEFWSTGGRGPSAGHRPMLRRVSLRNYKSIGKCDIRLSGLTILVGRNGSGKSNFLDALRFVNDSLQTTLGNAIRTRGGIDAVRRKSTGHPRNFAIELEVVLPDWKLGRYGFEVSTRQKGAFVITWEELRIEDKGRTYGYRVERGQVVDGSWKPMPPAVQDRLYLVTAAGYPDLQPMYKFLLSMGFCNLAPDSMKELQSPDAGELLHRDGSNISSVVGRLASDKPEIMARIQNYLESIVPGVTGVERVALGPRETLQFKQRVVGSPSSWKFFASSMSDGTLRTLGILVAVTQLAERQAEIGLVAIEEPETALHPAAAGALIDALREAASHTQIVMTSHSPDLLDQVALEDAEKESLLVVISDEGKTRIAPVDAASRQAITNHLYSPGELLRLDQLEPDSQDLRRQDQLKLFTGYEGED